MSCSGEARYLTHTSAALAGSELSENDPLFHDALSHEALFHDAEFQEALSQEALFHEAESHEALSQEADSHEALSQLAFVLATEYHDAWSKAGWPEPESTETNCSSTAFGFAVPSVAFAAAACRTPKPSAANDG